MIDSSESIMYENVRKIGYEEGYSDGLNVNVGIFTPRQGEYVTLFYDLNSTDILVLNEAMDSLQGKMPQCNIIALPKEICLKSCNKDFFKNYMELLQEAIDEME